MRLARLAGTVLALASPVAAQAVGFERTDYPGGGDARWVELGDLDGDGLLDVAAALYADDALGVRLGTGGGALGAEVTSPAGDAPTSLALGDVDGDGDLDAAVVHATLPRLWLLAGDGGASLVPTTVVLAGQGSVSVELADLDLDGDLDAVVGNAGSEDVRVLLGDGLGAFPGSTSYLADAAVSHVALDDIDLDGDLDVAASRGFPYFSPLVLENDAAGAFVAVPNSSMSGVPRWIALGDLTGDGLPDAASPTEDGLDTLLEVARNDGNNAFTSYSLIGLGETSMNELGDLNGDAFLDHLAVGFDGVVRVYVGDGMGPGTTVTVPTDAPPPLHMVLGDLDLDGALDFVTANGGDAGVTVMRNDTCSPPVVDTVDPGVVPNATLGPAPVVAVTGCGLSGVSGVVVDGTALPPQELHLQDDEHLTFDMPLVSLTGLVDVELVTPDASTTIAVRVVPADPPLCVLEDEYPAFLDPIEPAEVLLAAAPGNLYVLFGSTVILPTILPGLLELEIGNGFSSLVILSASVLGPGGWKQESYPLGGLPPGAFFYLQGATLESPTAAPPLASTNLATGAIQP